METNGSEESGKRLDRIERILEQVANDLKQSTAANEIEHQKFAQEYQLLLRAQVVQQEQWRKIDLAMLETTEKLNALINTVDGIIANRASKPPDSV